jgi:hypothetical protein
MSEKATRGGDRPAPDAEVGHDFMDCAISLQLPTMTE